MSRKQRDPVLERLEVGLCAFVVNGVRPDIPLGDVFRGIWPFLLADVVTVALLTAFPELVTFVLGFRVR
jgi:TRAP-type C4-dicarboxylate transport system permease large subunit